MQISPDNEWVVTGSRDWSIRVFMLSDLALVHRIPNAHTGITPFSPLLVAYCKKNTKT